VRLRQVPIFLLAPVFAALVLACGDERSVTTPTPTPPAPAPAPIVSVEVTPHEVTLAAPGQTQQLSAAARRADGTISDASADVIWSTADPAIATVSARGLVTARGYGTTSVHARTGEQYWNPVQLRVPVPPELRVPVTGVVRNQHGIPVSGADVGLLFGDVEHTGRTDGNGFFDMGTAYGAIRLSVTRFGYDTARLTVPDVAAQRHLPIVLVENPSPYVERYLEGAFGGPGEPPHTYRIGTRAGAILDVLLEQEGCNPSGQHAGPRSHDGPGPGLGMRLTSGGHTLVGETYGACRGRIKGTVSESECRLEVFGSARLRYTVRFREPR
jgi:hypothetical protein